MATIGELFKLSEKYGFVTLYWANQKLGKKRASVKKWEMICKQLCKKNS